MMFALLSDVKSGKIKAGSKIVALHTGGLQGLTSIQPLLDFKV